MHQACLKCFTGGRLYSFHVREKLSNLHILSYIIFTKSLGRHRQLHCTEEEAEARTGKAALGAS